jgi:ferredoxin
MAIIQQVLFIIVFTCALYFFGKRIFRIRRNILLGAAVDLSDNPTQRLKNMTMFALGQKKMFKNWIPAVFHLFIYVAFVLTQIELLEIIIDGATGSHRFLYHLVENTPLRGLYVGLISFIEILSVLAFVGTLVFLWRRNVSKVARFQKAELKGFPFLDGNIILVMEVWLISCVLLANTADMAHKAGEYGFVITSMFYKSLNGLSENTIIILERIGWWGHLVGILGFMIYLPFSKHLHIFLSFPNTYFGPLTQDQNGEMTAMPSITNEVKLMLDPNATLLPIAADAPTKFGAKDVRDLSWKNLLDAYSCTECGRCTAACPANQTDKLLSPRKIMMDTRDRVEELAMAIDSKQGDTKYDDGRSLLRDYISEEELRACTTCNACVEECPININPLNIILQLRRYMVMEESNAPQEWNGMFSNIENNMAPWKFSPEQRGAWAGK